MKFGTPLIERCDYFDPLRLHQINPQRYPYVLESSAGDTLGRYDLVFAYPGNTLVLENMTTLRGPAVADEVDFLAALDNWWTKERIDTEDCSLPFVGGWFLFLGYELAGQVEPTLNLARGGDLPVAFATRIPAVCIVDHQDRCGYVVVETSHTKVLQQLHQDVAASLNGNPVPVTGNLISEWDEDEPEHFLDGVTKTKQYIQQGDIYQANLSRAWRGQLRPDVDAAALYQRLRQSNPAPFGGLVTWKDRAVVSSSPERLLRIHGSNVETRPIAGTRPRSGHDAEDRALSEELFAHPKERAEHIMLIDLERNDLGRICEAGTVKVDEMMVLESYARVHHIVSNVTGELRARVTPGNAIRAVFPGGTITGCPKVRCMEIISELEREVRSAYTGSVGYLNHNGNLDLNILIRTFVVKNRSVNLRAGAGIVADSEPHAELTEARDKARGLIDAFG